MRIWIYVEVPLMVTKYEFVGMMSGRLKILIRKSYDTPSLAENNRE